ncbi:MAG: carbon-nitrogen hydrolase family protein [Gaiellales bacterium]
MSERFTAAVVQHPPVFLDRERSLDRAADLVGEAVGAGASLVAFGETWLPGYPAWVFGSAGWDDPAAKRVFARYQENAVEVPGPATRALGELARAHGVHLVMGCTERDATFSRGTLYNSLLFFGPDGDLLGVHRKLVPTHAERLVWGQGDGSGLRVYETAVGRLGGLVCWEHWMPLTRFALHALGEQVHVAAWPEGPDIHHLASRHYAFEGRCYVLCAASYLSLADLPADFELREVLGEAGDFGQADDVVIPGGSGIIGPDSTWVAGPLVGEAGIVYGEIDLGRIAQEQLALDSAGHYNRPDIFDLSVDRRPRAHARFLEPDGPTGRDAPLA